MLTVTAPLPAHIKLDWAFFGFEEADEADPFADFKDSR